MRRAFFVSMWILGFSYALQLLVMGNSGFIAYSQALVLYEKMEENVAKLSLKSFETEAKLSFLKSNIAGNVAHELGYFQSGEFAVFPVISAFPATNETIPLLRYKKEDSTNTSLSFFQVSCSISLLSFCLLLGYSILVKHKQRKDQCSLVQTASRT